MMARHPAVSCDLIVTLFSASHIYVYGKPQTEQQRKAAREAVQLNELAVCDNIKCRRGYVQK